MKEILMLSAFILIFNIPFGLWRSRVKKFSKQWFFAVHLPVPVIVGTRLFLEIPLTLKSFPFFVASYFTGQMIGGRINKK